MKRLLFHYVHTKTFKTTDHLMRTQKVKSIEQLTNELCKLSDFVSEAENLSICLCRDWKYDFDDITKFRTVGYSEKMTQIVN